MNIRKSREIAMKLLYQNTINKSNYEDLIEDFKENYADKDLDNLNLSYIIRVLKGVEENKDLIDDEIKKHLKNWKMDRISKINISILRLAIYEIKFEETIPYKVSVNEAIEIAKKYSDDKSPAFINAVLDSFK